MKKIGFIIFVMVILSILRNFNTDKQSYQVCEKPKSDTLLVGAVRIVDNRTIIINQKPNDKSAIFIEAAKGDTLIIAGETEKDWYKVVCHSKTGYCTESTLHSGTVAAGTPVWNVWLKHNFHMDRPMFWVLILICLIVLLALPTGILRIQHILPQRTAESNPLFAPGRALRFIQQCFASDFKLFYLLTVFSGIAVMIVAIFYDNSFVKMTDYGIAYLFNGDSTESYLLFVIAGIFFTALIRESVGGFLIFTPAGGLVWTLLLVLVPLIVIPSVMLLFITVVMIIIGIVFLFILFHILGAAGGAGGAFAIGGGRSSEEDYYYATCPVCHGSRNSCPPDSMSYGCSRCDNQGRIRIHR